MTTYSLKSLFLVALFVPTFSWANTAVKFEKDNSAGSVMIQGFQDDDASTFYASLGVPEQSNGKVAQKTYLSPDKGFQILCKVPVFASIPLCVLRIMASPHSLIDGKTKRLGYELVGEETVPLLGIFERTPFQFQSNDRKLTVTAEANHFLVQYKD